MDVIARLRRVAFARPSLLVLAAPEATAVRIAVERFARGHGWPMATGPADADVLVTAGSLAADLAAIADTVHGQLAAPCERIDVIEPEQVAERLPELPDRLARGGTPRLARSPEEPPMAGRVDDPDGLTLDVLHVPLGPVLPFWQPGLRLHVQLRGDVIGQAHAETLGVDGKTGSFWDTAPAGARALDASARVFGVAGWHTAHVRCLALRDRLLEPARNDGGGGASGDRMSGELRRLARAARLLEPELRGLAAVPDAGDAAERFRGWLAVASAAAPVQAIAGKAAARTTPAGATPDPVGSARAFDLLPELLTGVELGAARLAVASLDIDVAEVGSRAAAGAGHG